MAWRTRIWWLLAAVLWLSACADHGNEQTPAPPAQKADGGFPRSVRDGSGALVTLKAPPTRIVSQTLGTDEILWEICSHARLAGISQISREPKYSVLADDIKAAGIAAIVNAEEILQLQPDLIFVASFSRAETVQSLQASGAPVFRFANYDSLADIQQNIRLVGQAIGAEAEAEKLVARMNTELAAVKARIPANAPPPRVLSYSLSGNTAGAQTLFDSIVRAAGAVNVAAEKGLNGFPKIGPEQIVEWQPDYLLAGAEETKGEQTRQQLLTHPVIATTKAGRAGHVIVLDARYLLSVSQFITRAVSELADALYGPASQPQPASP